MAAYAAQITIISSQTYAGFTTIEQLVLAVDYFIA